jgi:predicted nucleic acid-binding protein
VSDIVVSDSTCLIGLERIHRLDLLPAVFERVWIPPVVAEEFGQSLPWLHLKAPVNTDLVESFETMVDPGEAAAIALARELHCEVILDDRRARQLAKAHHVPHLGLLGLLLRAKQKGCLDRIRPAIEALRAQGFFLSDEVVVEALRRAGE